MLESRQQHKAFRINDMVVFSDTDYQDEKLVLGKFYRVEIRSVNGTGHKIGFDPKGPMYDASMFSYGWDYGSK